MDNMELDRILGDAANRELEAKDFYSGVAKKCRSTSIRELFEQLASEEMKHFEMLEVFRHDPTMLIKIAPPDADWKVAESQELPRLDIAMQPKDAVALAMKKEQQAVEFYRSIAAVGTPETRDIFENLANMELGHKHNLEKMFIDVGYPEVF